MAKKAKIISFKEAYSKVNDELEKKEKVRSKKASKSQVKRNTKKEKTQKTNDEKKEENKDSKKDNKKEVKKQNIKTKVVKNKENKTEISKKKEKDTVKKVPKKKKKFEIKKRFIVILIIFILLILIGVGIYFLWTSTYFNLTNVQIKPTKKYTLDEIWDKADIVYGKNIFLYDTKKTKEGIETLPYIKDIKITKKLPGTLVIEVTERQKAYVCFNNETGEYIYISDDGYILEKVTRDLITVDDKIISGIVFDDIIELGTKLNDVELSKLIAFQDIIENCSKENITRKITSANFINSTIEIMLDDKIKVIFPNTEKLTYNVRFLKKILEEIDDVPGTIDMTKPNPSFIYSDI